MAISNPTALVLGATSIVPLVNFAEHAEGAVNSAHSRQRLDVCHHGLQEPYGLSQVVRSLFTESERFLGANLSVMRMVEVRTGDMDNLSDQVAY